MMPAVPGATGHPGARRSLAAVAAAWAVALVGACAAQALLARPHDRQILRLRG